MKENLIFSEKETPPTKAKYVNAYSDGSKAEVECMYSPDERRVYDIASEQFSTDDLVKEMVEEYVILPNGTIIRNNLNTEF